MNTEMQNMYWYTGQLVLDMDVHICNEFGMYSSSLTLFVIRPQSTFCGNLVGKANPATLLAQHVEQRSAPKIFSSRRHTVTICTTVKQTLLSYTALVTI